MAYDERLARRIRELLTGQDGLVEKKMFGGVGFMLHGNMACGVIGDDVVVRVGPDAYGDLIMRPHTGPFDFTGRPMKGWLVVEPAGVASNEDLNRWVSLGTSFALSLPPK
ncbi:MAG: TfoX/Sxy family protein [Chloroflexota bacterium]|jgi:hypothetical protein